MRKKGCLKLARELECMPQGHHSNQKTWKEKMLDSKQMYGRHVCILEWVWAPLVGNVIIFSYHQNAFL